PVSEAAEPEAVVKLLTALGNVEIVDFCDAGDPGPERTGLDKPIAELTIEADQRDADGKSRTIAQGLKVGRPADIGGKAVYVAIPGESETPGRVVMASAESLAAMSTDWTGYASRRSLQVPAADIGRVALRATPGGTGSGVTVFERTLDGWNVLEGSAAAV